MIGAPHPKLLGYVQVRFGEKWFAVPVQTVRFERDSAAAPGGFFDEEGELGILVDSQAGEVDVNAQIKRASVDAIRHIARKFLN